MLIMERPNQRYQQDSMTSIPSTSSNSSDFIHKVSSNPARRSIDWRDSGIVIDDDYQLGFNSFDTNSSEHSSELRFTNLDQCAQQQQERRHNVFTLQWPITGPPPSEACPVQEIALNQDEDGDTILHLAVVGFSEKKVQDLIKVCNINAKNNMMQTPLHIAILANRTSIVELLVKQPDIKLDCFDRRGNAPIHLACQMGLREMVEILLDSLNQTGAGDASNKLKNLIEMTNFDGQTCLHLAASNDRRDVIETLIKNYHANLNCRDSKSGETILHKAISKLNVDLVKLILDLSEQQIDLERRHFNRTDYSGRGPLDKARIMLESRPDDQSQVERLNQISQMIFERVRSCSSQGCPECSSTKSERNLRLISRSQDGLLIDDESASASPCMSSSEFSDSDYEMDL